MFSHTAVIHQEKTNTYARKIAKYLNGAAEAANVGILLEALVRLFPWLAPFIMVPPLNYLILLGDPLIYFFRALVRLTRLVGRHAFGVEFQEEDHGREKHKWQTEGDVISLCLFVLAIVLFTGAIIASPVGITLAWTVGLLAVACNIYFDYIWPEREAYRLWQEVVTAGISGHQEERTHTEYIKLKIARQMYLSTFVLMAMLLICGSAIAFAPPVLVPILLIVSNGASLGLGCLFIGRFYHHHIADTKFGKWAHGIYERLFSKNAVLEDNQKPSSNLRINTAISGHNQCMPVQEPASPSPSIPESPLSPKSGPQFFPPSPPPSPHDDLGSDDDLDALHNLQMRVEDYDFQAQSVTIPEL